MTKNATTPDTKGWELPLLIRAKDNLVTALMQNAGNPVALINARLTEQGAEAADDAARRVYGLTRTLREAYERLLKAQTIDEARSALAWLRTDAWDTVQRDLAALDALSQALRK
ncbi:MAG: hypothetical protein KJ057_12980 [Phycisphaerae bacterium]|nr:MAG: hypothetical protein EDS66_16550 [Planctomycetota bacterium]MBE7457419.1 hypothetical protein [Planctomycetia bacterium]MCL4719378.1 hypothetical protein [Phycisphaerae bacterium]